MFDWLRRGYSRWLNGSLNYLPVTATFAALVLGSIYLPLQRDQRASSPRRRTRASSSPSPPRRPTRPSTSASSISRQIYDDRRQPPETDHVFQLDVPGQSIAGYVLKPWDKRTLDLQPAPADHAASSPASPARRSWPSSRRRCPARPACPIQFVINTTGPFEPLNDVAQKFLQEALATGRFIFLQHRPQDRRAAGHGRDRPRQGGSQLGLKMSDIGAALGSMLGGGYVNYFALDGRSYKVIPQVQQSSRLNIDQILDYHIRAADGSSVPLVDGGQDRHQGDPAVAEPLPAAQQRHHPGRGLPRRVAGRGAGRPCRSSRRARCRRATSVDYGGASRQYMQESGGFIVTSNT